MQISAHLLKPMLQQAPFAQCNNLPCACAACTVVKMSPNDRAGRKEGSAKEEKKARPSCCSSRCVSCGGRLRTGLPSRGNNTRKKTVKCEPTSEIQKKCGSYTRCCNSVGKNSKNMEPLASHFGLIGVFGRKPLVPKKRLVVQ